MERMRRSSHGAGLGTYVSRQRSGKSRRVGCIADGAPHREGQSTTGAKNSTHLTQGPGTIREELEPLLTENHIEDAVLECQGRGVADSPLDDSRWHFSI